MQFNIPPSPWGLALSSCPTLVPGTSACGYAWSAADAVGTGRFPARDERRLGRAREKWAASECGTRCGALTAPKQKHSRRGVRDARTWNSSRLIGRARSTSHITHSVSSLSIHERPENCRNAQRQIAAAPFVTSICIASGDFTIRHTGRYLVDRFGGSVEGRRNPGSKGCRERPFRRDDPAFDPTAALTSVLLLDVCSPRYGPSVRLPCHRRADSRAEFLRLSRSAIDDTITQNLNALETPARAGFDPASTSRVGPRPLSHQIDPAACHSFKDKVLFPSWQARSDVLSYCSLVATSPDPDDPEAALREAENEKNRERVVDERLDPYSARFFPKEARTEMLANTVRTEMGVENIVRSRTWDIVRRRCGDSNHATWGDALADWRKYKDTSESRR